MHLITSILILFSFITISFSKFRCGNDDFQTGIAENLIRNDCKGRIGRIDACCWKHKQCYVKKTKQNVCDGIFCKCVENASKGLPICQIHTNNFCTTARTFGGIQYNKPPQG